MKNVVLCIRNQKMGGNMRHKIKKIVISYILSICCILSFTIGSFKSHNVYASYSRYITAKSLTVRKKASIKGKVAGYYKKGQKLLAIARVETGRKLNMEVTNIMYLRNIFLQRNHQRLQKVVHMSVM